MVSFALDYMAQMNQIHMCQYIGAICTPRISHPINPILCRAKYCIIIHYVSNKSYTSSELK